MKTESVLAFVSTALSLLVFPAPADAVGVGGWGGNGVGGNNTSNGSWCFQEDFGAVTYNNNIACQGSGGCCSGWQYWEVGLPVNSGSYNPTVGVTWPSASTMGDYISCNTYSQSQTNTGSAYESTGFICNCGNTSGSNAFQPGSVSVPSFGFLYVTCAMAQDASLISVNY
jgi:hypothetical protein